MEISGQKIDSTKTAGMCQIEKETRSAKLILKETKSGRVARRIRTNENKTISIC